MCGAVDTAVLSGDALVQGRRVRLHPAACRFMFPIFIVLRFDGNCKRLSEKTGRRGAPVHWERPVCRGGPMGRPPSAALPGEERTRGAAPVGRNPLRTGFPRFPLDFCPPRGYTVFELVKL